MSGKSVQQYVMFTGIFFEAGNETGTLPSSLPAPVAGSCRHAGVDAGSGLKRWAHMASLCMGTTKDTQNRFPCKHSSNPRVKSDTDKVYLNPKPS